MFRIRIDIATVVVELPTTPDDWSELTGHDLDAKLRELDVVQRRVEAASVGSVDHAERTAHVELDGHRTVSAWLTATTNCTRAEATGRDRSAHLLRDLTDTADEFAAGRVGIAQVRAAPPPIRARVDG